MKKTAILIAAGLVALTSTTAIVTAKGGPDGDNSRRGAMIERMFENLDTNQDGSITQAEIEAAGAERFAAADTNGDGLLSAEEMTAAAEARDADRRANRAEKRIERLDANDDGLLSLEEMQAGSKRMERLFERLDADGDGVITQAEAEAAKMRRPHGRGADNN